MKVVAHSVRKQVSGSVLVTITGQECRATPLPHQIFCLSGSAACAQNRHNARVQQQVVAPHLESEASQVQHQDQMYTSAKAALSMPGITNLVYALAVCW